MPFQIEKHDFLALNGGPEFNLMNLHHS
ncbi:MAG: hypothetical protein Q8880_06235 [Bacteroidota bacterium]|nr:hypothetical protein [Bacteroidota bacterium]